MEGLPTGGAQGGSMAESEQENVGPLTASVGLFSYSCVWTLGPLWDCGTLVICISIPYFSSAPGAECGRMTVGSKIGVRLPKVCLFFFF